MEHIACVGNTEIPAYLALLRNGCRVERVTLPDGGESWVAEQDGLRVSGASPIEVLGLYCMRKQRGGNWKATDSEIEDFMKLFHHQA